MKIQKFVFIALSTILLYTCVIKEELPPNPIADFEIINTKEGKVTFRNTSQNASTYLWNFGDNNISNEVTPTHTYTKEGIYTIILTAYGFETDTMSKQVQIILDRPPTDILLSNDTILENQPAGTLVGILSTVGPNAGNTHIYSLVAGNGSSGNSSFTISNDQLRSNQSFDYETQTIYSIRIRTDDNKGGILEKIFLINIKDLFEGIPNQSPTDILLSDNTILENQPIGTLVGILSTADPNVGDMHTYSLVAGMGDADNSSFTIDGDELKSNEAFDYETKDTYYIRVKSEDQRGGSIEKPFTIMVKNIIGGWHLATASAVWTGRWGHTSVVFDNKIWIMGGIVAASNLQNDIWCSDDGIDWQEVTTSSIWDERGYHTSVVFGAKIWVMGGLTFSHFSTNDVWQSSHARNWKEISPHSIFSGWRTRIGHTSVTYNNKIWVIGGDKVLNVRLNDVWYSNNGINWTESTPNAAWSIRQFHTSVVFDNGSGKKIWILGGSDGTNRLNDVWYSSDGVSWTEATNSALWSERSRHTSVVFNNKIWVLGGRDNSRDLLKDVWYSDDGINWIEAPIMTSHWISRWGHTSIVFNGKIWVMGGNNNGNGLNDIWYYEKD